MLQTGRADAWIDDDNILAGNIASARTPGDFRIAGETFAVEPIAIMLRRDDPAFKAAVDAQLRRLMADGELAKLYDKWFVQPIPPRNAALNLPMSAALRQAIAAPNDNPSEAYQAR